MVAIIIGALIWAVCAFDPGDPGPASYRECEKWEREFLTGGPDARHARAAFIEEDCWNRRWNE